MYPIPPSETLVERKNCRQCSTDFPITDRDIEFYSKVSPVFPSWGVSPWNGDGVDIPKKYLIPPPTLCPDCRQQRRLAFHNERRLYKRNCDATGKDIISIYSRDKPYTVYHQDYFRSDNWNPMDYGSEFDFQKNFFEQFQNLFYKVPKIALIIQECENAMYLNFVYRLKNCYHIFASGRDEDCYYGNRVNVSKNCVDCLLIKDSENCYECINTFNAYHCQYSKWIKNCNSCVFVEDSEGCNDCFMCINLENKKYYIKNIAYTETEYRAKIEEYKQVPIKQIFEEYALFLTSQPHKWYNHIQVENWTWDNVQSAKNIKNVFDGDILENVAYSAFVDDVTECMDIDYWYGNTVLQYECLGTGSNAYMWIFSLNIWPDVAYMMYCDACIGCQYCFGCTWLRHKQYCILNKQYTKEEYEILVPKIIEKMITDGEWGEFFPASLSPFGYNETVASEYFPLEKEEAREQWFNWSDYEAPFPSVSKVIPASKLPESIESIPDDILNWAVECEVSKKPFRIIRQELEFYRKHNLPIPRRHPDVRHMDRMKLRNPRKLFERKCDHCEKMMITTYAPERPETVYCESCYEWEVLK